MAKSRIQGWLALGLGAVGLLVVGIPGMWLFVGATAKTLHPKEQEVPSVAGSATEGKWEEAAEKGREMVRSSLAGENLPGMSVAVGIGDELVWAEAFGFADLDNSVPVTPAHRFRIGTASIVLTSAAAGLLLESGRLKLDDAIQKYVPAFPEKEWPVTLRQLMGHTAGIRNDGGDEGPLLGRHCEKVAEGFAEFAERPLLFAPATKFRYSSYGWIVVSTAIEGAANEPFLAFMQKRVFDPLGMRDTIPDAPPSGDRVTSYFPRFAADPKYGLHLMRDIDLSCYAGASAFVSTPSDLVRFGLAMNRGKLLQPATVKMLQTSQRLESGKETGYGLGWSLETATLSGQPVRAAGHNGNLLGGMAATVLTFPEKNMAVAVTSNISYAGTRALALKLAQAFAAQSPSTR